STPPPFLRFSFPDPPPTDIYTLSLHDALPIFAQPAILTTSVALFEAMVESVNQKIGRRVTDGSEPRGVLALPEQMRPIFWFTDRSEEHTSELQSRSDLVCRLLLEKKKKNAQLR